MAPLPPLSGNPGLARAAAEHAGDQGRDGRTGHVGSDGSSLTERIHRQNVWSRSSAEAISYGQANAEAVVRQLVIDDGMAGRGHRAVLFDPWLRFAGVGCGYHSTWGSMCVIDFTGPLVVR